MSDKEQVNLQIIEDYVSEDPTPETTLSILESLSNKHGRTVNEVRVLLSKRGVYVSQAKPTSAKSDKPKKVSKADAQEALSTIISANGAEVDEAIISKLTGKAAVYLTNVLTKITEE